MSYENFHLEINNQSISVDQLEKTDNTYKYSFPISGDTDVRIVYGQWRNGPTSSDGNWITYTPPSPVTQPWKNNPYTLSGENSWKTVIKNLPKTGTLNGKDVYYTYEVREVSVPDYETSYVNNDNIPTGTITVQNKATKMPEYELPETGGTGTTLYTIEGLLLMAAAGILLLYKRQIFHSK